MTETFRVEEKADHPPFAKTASDGPEEPIEEETMRKSSNAEPDVVSSPERDGGDKTTERRDSETLTDTTAPKVQTRVRPRRRLRVLVVIGRLILLALALAIAWIVLWTLGRSTDRQVETFSEPIDQVIVEEVNGRVTFEAGTTTEVTVEREWLLTDRPEVLMVADNGTLRITAKCGAFCQTHITGTAPAGAKIVVRTEAGYIDVTGFGGGVDLNTSAGNVNVTGINGPAKLRSDAGSIRGDISDGDVDAQTSAGGIDLVVLGDFSRISAVSDAGSVSLTVPDDVYRVDADTSVGRTEVNVSTAPDAARVIVARSDVGNVTIDRVLAAAGAAAAQEGLGAPGGGSPVIPSGELGPTDAAELEGFLDELLLSQMEENHIPGAAVAVVRDGQVLLAKGYGYADLENGIPVDPELTVFRIGSSGKVFTWTAVMQLVEQGRLDLGADINTYLDFRIPDTYPQPITLEHLLTHTAGFEESWYETFTLDADEVLPAGEWLAAHIPARVRPPGDSPAYSNYGAELAGYIVERASGRSYGQYIQEHILDPLGMAYSSATGMPGNPRAQASVGYFYDDGAFEPVPDLGDDYFGQIAMAPAGGHASSVADMARFLIAHLQDGFYGDEASEMRILGESTARQMQTILYAPDPRLQGTAYGLFDFSDNGQWALGHNGDTLGFRSLLLLIPDQNLGVFVVYNSETAAGLELQHLGFQRAFFDHYFPAPPVEPIQPSADFDEGAGRFEGTYQLTQMSYTTLEKFMEVSGGGQVEISSPGDGTLLWTTPWGVWKFVEVEPLYFRQVDRSFGIAFREDGQGRITHLFSDMTPMYTFEKLAWYETAGFNMALLGATLLIFLSMIVAATIGAVRSRRHRGEAKDETRGTRASTRILLGISALNVLFVLGTFIWGNPRPMFGVSPAFQVVLGLGVLSAALTAGALVGMALAWKDRYWGTASRLYYSVVSVAALAFVWFLNQWNLLGWRF